MRPRSALYAHQASAAERIVQSRQLAVLLSPGLGKTSITETALVDLGVRRTLVLAPATIVKREVWRREAEEWGHLYHLRVRSLTGTPEQRRNKLVEPAVSALPPRIDVISYENAIWLTDQCDLTATYGAIVFDELSKLKSPGSARFKRLRHRAMDIPIRIGLTGSPVGNHLLDLWAEMFAVAGEAPLGPRYCDYKETYFEPVNPYAPLQSEWRLKAPELATEIHERVRPYSFSISPAAAGIKLPELRLNLIDLEIPKDVLRQADELASQCRTMLADGVELKALGATTLAGKMRQLLSGAVYTAGAGAGLDEEQPWSQVHTAKIDAVRELVEEAQGEPILLFYWYKHELERLKKAFPRAREAREKGALDAWDRREVPLLLAHPASAGHGLNLQKGGNTIVWFCLPFSHELYEQACGRLVRIGQPWDFVTAHVLLAGDGDRAVLELLRRKGDTQGALMQAVEMKRELTLEEVLS